MRAFKALAIATAVIGVGIAFLALNPSRQAEAQAAMGAGPMVKLQERSIGKADAPLVVEEFVSLTCSHCADFYLKIMPELKTRYVDTGKARFVLRDFPLDGTALRASALAHCMPEEQYFPFIKVLYENLEKWAFAKDPQQVMTQYAKLGGLPDDKAKACVSDAKILDALAAARTEAQEKYDIQGTPTFILNGKEKLNASSNVDEFVSAFDKALAEKGKTESKGK